MLVNQTLNNGIRLVGNQMKHVQSTAIGVWIGTGSAKESKQQSGISHFLEHMLFKGTTTRSSQDIAIGFDAIGAQNNAFTAKEYTCYHFKSISSHAKEGLEILADMVQHSVLDEIEMKREKSVVIEEILMTEDEPDDLVMDDLADIYFGDHPLGRPILGTAKSVNSFKKNDLKNYMEQEYVAENMVLSVSGDFDCEQIREQAEALFQDLPRGRAHEFAAAPENFSKCKVFHEKDIEQVQLCLALPGFSTQDPRYYDLMLLSNALGGSMSSRLFQKIREEKGLVYSVSSFPEGHVNTGVLYTYAGCVEENTAQVISLMIKEIQKLQKHGLTQEEFMRNKEQLKGNYVLSNESVNARMMSLGQNMVLFGQANESETILQKIDNITMDSVQAILPIVLDIQAMGGAFVGCIDKQKARLEKLW